MQTLLTPNDLGEVRVLLLQIPEESGRRPIFPHEAFDHAPGSKQGAVSSN